MPRLAERLTLFALASMLVGIPGVAAAADPIDGSLDYTVVSWDRGGGLPEGGITALMAARDRALWVGMDSGLYRFDGLRFVREASIDGAVTHLKDTRDGAVWVALADGRLARIAGARTSLYDTRHGLPTISATALVEDRQGQLWLGTRRGLYTFVDERWVGVTPEGLPAPMGVTGAAIDRDGRVLIAANSRLYRRDMGSATFAPLATLDTPGTATGICATGPDQIYVTDPIRGFAVIGRAGGPESPTRSIGLRVLCDASNNVWVGTGGAGLWRIPPSTDPSAARVVTGMLGELASSLAEDARGNIWVGSPAGLTRLTPNPMARLADLGVSTAIESTLDGHLWVGTFDGLIELVNLAGGIREHRRFLPAVRVRALHASASYLWVASEQGLARVDLLNRQVTPVATGVPVLRQIDSLSSDARGTLWIADAEQGLFTWNGRTLAPVTLPFRVGENPVNSLHVDRRGRTWLALERGVAVVHPDGRLVVHDEAGRGRASRRSRSILEDSTGAVWIGGIDSLAWFSDDAHRVFHQADGFPVDFVKGLGEGPGGDLWFAGDAAIVRISRAELQRVLGGGRRPFQVQFSLFGAADGAGVPRLLGDRSVTRAPNGILWFITGNGVTGIDPTLPAFGEAAVPVASVVGAIVDGRALETHAEGRLASSTRAVQIDYSALNIESPHRTRFRYRLRGFDDAWQDAGTRMTAFFTNLPVGRYEFEVAASNQINAWADPTARWSFEVEPAFYQTSWFPVLCVGLVALSGWGVWRYRLAQVQKQFNIVLGERVRLSREIHDTLLQSLVGVAVQCEVLAKDVERRPSEARDTLVRLRRQVEGHIREFRQAVSDLRAERDDFIAAIRDAGETAQRMSGAQFELVVRGRPRPSTGDIERHLLKIAREAVTNAARHARARAISVEVGYEDTLLRLRIKDDGRGFNPDSSTRADDGHCGLVSMQERAAEIGARFSISSTFGQGTEVEAVVPLSPA